MELIIADLEKMNELTKEFYQSMINQLNKKMGDSIISGCKCEEKSKSQSLSVHSYPSENGREEESKMIYLLIELTIEPTKYYICPSCAEIKTSQELDKMAENCGIVNCLCEFNDMQWDDKEQYFEPIFFRIYNDYKEIPKNLYEILVKVKNDIKRLKMYRSWTENSFRKA